MNKPLAIFAFLFLASCASTDNVENEKSQGYKELEKRNVFGYRDPLEALSDLKTKENHSYATFRGDHGEWEIITNNVNHSVWSFTPKEHPAHPSVIRRKTFEKDGNVYMGTEVQCGASKSVCDSLVKDFLELDQKIRKQARKM